VNGNAHPCDANRIGSQRLVKVSAAVKTLPGLKGMDNSFIEGKHLHQLASGQIDAQGTDVSGYFVLSDVGAAVLFDDKTTVTKWAINGRQCKRGIAP